MSQARGDPRLRVLHASPGAPGIDVHTDGSPAILGLDFGEISPYAALAKGRHAFEVYPLSGGSPVEALLETDLDLRAGQDYTLSIAGQMGRIEPVLLVDSTDAPAGDHAQVRVFHASPDAPPLDLAAAHRPMLFEDIRYRDVTPFREIPAGVVDLHFRPSGSTRSLITLPEYTLAGGSLYTFVALGLLEGTPAFLIMPLVETVEMILPV